jgi:hypothetical protein
MKLHEALHLIASTSAAYKEPQGSDAQVEGAGGYRVLRRLELTGTQVLGDGYFGRSSEKGREMLHILLRPGGLTRLDNKRRQAEKAMHHLGKGHQQEQHQNAGQMQGKQGAQRRGIAKAVKQQP